MPQIGLQPLDPLTGANFTLGNEGGPVVLRVRTDDVTISGPSKMQLQKVIYNEKQSRFEITAYHKLLKMTGNFYANGHILVVPVRSRGFFTFEFKDVQALHTLKMRKNIQEKLQDKTATFKVNNLSRVIVNLKDQNNAPSYGLNRLVNDNWKLVSQAMIPSMERSIQKIYSAALSPIFNSFTVNEILPQTLRNTLDT
ncbi:uncharacterized protein [Rhodnius prolixus]|uniref:uncharacterized protein n=1 Tax=Rhodnius prolixus TaxID=13249 RepID=UPI003D18B242